MSLPSPSLFPFRIAAALALLVHLAACASGTAIVTGTPKTPIDYKEVKLYADAPEQYETIGIVTASSDSGWSQQDSQNYAIKELKKQAAKLGANGILITSVEKGVSTVVVRPFTGGTNVVPISDQEVSGKAIYVTP